MATSRLVALGTVAVTAVIAGVVAAHARAPVAPPPAQGRCLAASVSHREHAEGPDGLTRDVTYRDRFYRCGDNVWIARILPPQREQASHEHEPHGGRHMPPLHELARLLTRRPESPSLSLVDVARRTVIDVDRGSFESVGVDPSFERAASLVAPNVTAAMRPLDRASSVAGARWLERAGSGRFLRVLWSDELEMALVVESGTTDGAISDEVRVELEAPPARWPWEELAPVRHVDISDFGD